MWRPDRIDAWCPAALGARFLDALLTTRALFWRLGFIPLAIGVGIAGDGLWFK